MGEIRDYSITADDNNSTPPAGAPEGMAPSTVNNTMREAYARIKRWYDDAQGAKTTAGSSNTYTLAAARTVASYAAGDNYVIKANHSNTGAATLNVDSVGAKAIVTPALNALEADSIRAGGVYQIAYEASADKFILVNGAHPSESQITLKNPTSEDTSGGRESQVVFKGLQSGSEETTLAKIQASHEGTSDDEKGQLIVGVNDGNDGASPTTAVTIASTGVVTFAKQPSFPDANPRQSNNFIRNGDMAIAQRSTQSIAAGGFAYGACDGWKIYSNSAMACDVSKDDESPDAFNNSLKLDITTAETSVAPGDFAYIEQRFEGLDLQSINKGDAQAKSLTLSFWVRSPVTGIHIVELMDLDNSNRSSSQSYTIASADTWEYHSVTYPPDTTGTLDNNKDGSLKIQFWLVAGTNYNPTSGTSLNTSWGTTTASRAVGQVNVLADDSDNFYLTGVQMELGQVASEFQYESFAENLARCQRYFVQYGITGGDADDYVVVGTGLVSTTANGYIEIKPPVPLRDRPAMTFNNVTLYDSSNGYLQTIGAVYVEDGTLYRSKSTVWLFVTRSGGGLTVGRVMHLYVNLTSVSNSYFQMSAEL